MPSMRPHFREDPVHSSLNRFGTRLAVVAGVTMVLLAACGAVAWGAVKSWTNTSGGAWTTGSNWSGGTVPATGDVVQFNGGGTYTVTAVPILSIAQLLVSGSTVVTLQAGGANTLTITGGTGADLDVASGSTLNVSGTNVLTIALSLGVTGSVTGNMTVSGALHRLTAADASPGGITFNSGGRFTQGTGCTGAVFGSATANSITFASGSEFIQQAGSNPFATTQFQTGSWFRFQQNSAPSFSGRTYANFEINFATYNQTSTGGSAFTVDNFTVTAGTAHLQLTNVNIKGNVSVVGGATLDFNPTAAAAIGFSGTSAQTVTKSGTLTFNNNANVTVSNPSGVTLNSAVTLPGTTTVNASSILATGAVLTNSGTLAVNGTLQLNANGSVSAGPTYAVGSLLKYNTGGIYGRGSEWSATSGAGYPANVQLSNSTTLDLGNGGTGTARQMGGNLTIDAGSVFAMDNASNDMTAALTALGNLQLDGILSLSDASGGDLYLAGNWTRAGGSTFNPKSRVVIFNGSAPQSLTGATTFDYVTLNNPTGLLLNNSMGVERVLTLTSGKITTGPNTVVIGTNGSVAGAGGGGGGGRYVNGSLEMPINVAGGSASQTFDIGDAAVYAPVSLNFPGTAFTSGRVLASTTAGDHTLIASSGLDAAKTVNRTWSFIMQPGLTFNTYDATYTFDPSDVDAGANYNNFEVRRFDSGTWYPTTAGTRTTTSTQATGITSFSDFQIGEQGCVPVTLSLSKTDITCNGAGDGTVTATFSGGTGTLQVQIDAGGYSVQTSPYTFTGLAGGSHTVDVKDANNCTTPASITVDEPSALSLTLTKTDITCNGAGDGTVTATFSGGTGTLQVQIDAGGYSVQTSPYTFAGLAGGSHTVDVKDANNCTTPSSITVNEPVLLTVTATPSSPTVCTGGTTTVTVTASGGTSPYTGEGVFSQGAGTVVYTVTDAMGCTANASVTITVNTYAIVATAGSGGSISPPGTTNVPCGTDQTYSITPDPGYGIADVLVDGGSVGPVATYPFTNVTAGHTITASFAALPVHNLNSGLYFATIQAAIDDAGTLAGHTIRVAVGSFSGTVIVTKSVTLQGAQFGVDGRGGRGAESIITSADANGSFQVQADNVTIDGFKFVGAAKAIHVNGGTPSSAVTVVNNIVAGDRKSVV